MDRPMNFCLGTSIKSKLKSKKAFRNRDVISLWNFKCVCRSLKCQFPSFILQGIFRKRFFWQFYYIKPHTTEFRAQWHFSLAVAAIAGAVTRCVCTACITCVFCPAQRPAAELCNTPDIPVLVLPVQALTWRHPLLRPALSWAESHSTASAGTTKAAAGPHLPRSHDPAASKRQPRGAA